MFLLVIAAPFLVILVSLLIGRYPVDIATVLNILGCRLTMQPCYIEDIYQTVVWDIRLPRAILGLWWEAVWLSAGQPFRGLFRNPLVSSGILGVSSGAGFGAALAIILFHQVAAIYTFAFYLASWRLCSVI